MLGHRVRDCDHVVKPCGFGGGVSVLHRHGLLEWLSIVASIFHVAPLVDNG
jgi:hypothetical protein